MTDDRTFRCDTCERTVSLEAAHRSETMGGLDPAKWQTLSCPTCGSRLATVFVGEETG